jgi:AraC-like DNA-binding protein
MSHIPSRSGGEGLEQSCGERPEDWFRQTDAAEGVELFEAWFRGAAYRRHRHATYAIGLTETGVQAFDYRGATRISMPGEVFVLHPDETHDGRAGGDEGFGYRQVYVEPAAIFAAVRSLTGRPCALPFVREPVVRSPTLDASIRGVFRDGTEPLALDDLVVRLAEGLLAADPSCGRIGGATRLDLAAIERARQFLDAETSRVVRSAELEAVTGLTRYDLARQFRAVLGTSPYRYSLPRRLAFARDLIGRGQTLVDVALEAGFADQAHLTRKFVAAYGMTPGQYGVLRDPRTHDPTPEAAQATPGLSKSRRHVPADIIPSVGIR